MNIIKLNATDSTNSFLNELAKKRNLESPTIVIAENQIAGRGQRDSSWYFEPSKSLAMSVFVRPNQLLIQDQFYLSMVVAVSLEMVLKRYNLPKVKVKWPNDILSRSKKTAGILIENTVKSELIYSSIIGIGLNVNNESIPHLARAGSMFTQTQVKFDKEKVALEIVDELLRNFKRLNNHDFYSIKQEYEAKLFRNGKVSSFKDVQGRLFQGIIRGVNNCGQLMVETSLSQNKLFWPKEVSLEY